MMDSNIESVLLVVLCDRCTGLSEDLNVCSHCGNVLLENSKPTEDEGSSQQKRSRRREINPYGMYLYEQKLELREKNSARKLDVDAALVRWRNMSEEERIKYKTMSFEDRKSLKVGDGKETTVIEENMKDRKRLKKEYDAKTVAVKRKATDDLKRDAECSKVLLKSMIAEKRVALAGIEKEIIGCDEELEKLSTEMNVAEKLKGLKKEELNVVKKEYKKLFAEHNLCAQKKLL